MGLFFNSIFKSKRPFVLVIHLDVGRGNCRAALISDDHHKEMVCTYLGTEKINLGPYRKNLQITLSSLKDVLDHVFKFIESSKDAEKYLISVEKIYVILAAPYYLSHTANVKYKENNPFVVTTELVASLLKDYRKSVGSLSQDREAVKIGEKNKILSERVVAVSLNGYHTSAPYGKKASTLDLSIFRTETSSEVCSAVSRQIERHSNAPVFFEPLSLAVYVALRDNVHFDKDFIFVVVGAEVTEVSIVRNFTLLETASFPFGKHSLVRHISRELSTPEEIVLSEISIYIRGEILESRKKEIESVISTGGKKWSPFFERALASFSDVSTVPSALYLVADSESRPLFQGFLETDSWSGQTITPSGFSVKSVDTELAKNLMKFGRGASCDTILCLEGLFAVSTKLPVNMFD